MKKTLLGCLVLTASIIHAQDKTVDDLKKESGKTIKKDADDSARTWKKGGVIGFNLAQASLNNWAAGGDEFSLSINSALNLFAFYKKGRSGWDNTFDFNLGYIKTTSLGQRKNDDRVDLLSKYGYAISENWNAAGIFNFRSQFFKGFVYENNNRFLSSAFLSPAYVLMGAGLDFKPNEHFSVFISPATVRLTILRHDSLSAKGLYGVDSFSHHRWEFGAFLSAGFIKDLNKIVSYKGRLDLFSNYGHNPEKVDVLMNNLFAAKIAKWLNATWSVDLVYDDDVRLFGPNKNEAAIQVKSLVGLGVLLKF
jgi:hypothetical protein